MYGNTIRNYNLFDLTFQGKEQCLLFPNETFLSSKDYGANI